MYKYLIYVLILVSIFDYGYSQQLMIRSRLLANNFTIDDSEFPKLSSMIEVKDGINQIEVKKENIVIVEGAFVTNAIEVSPITNGWQKITWIPEKQDFTLPSGYIYRAAMVITIGNKIGVNNLLYKELDINPYFNIKASLNKKDFAIREYNFGTCKPGDSIPALFKFKGLLTSNFNPETRMFLDSITVKNPKVFNVLWDGSAVGYDDQPPPRYLNTYNVYHLYVRFKPETTEPYYDELVFHYEKGLKIIIPLYGNLRQIPSNTVLKLVQPLGGEVLTPCQDYLIKWRGNTPNLATKVEVSYDKGTSWKQIAFVKDSQFVWNVPDVVTNDVRIRVSQEFSNPSSYRVNDGTSLPRAVAFNSTDSRLLNVAENGYIYEWDLMKDDKPLQIKKYQLNNAENSRKFAITGAEYINDDTSFWVSFFEPNSFRDSIAFYNYQGGEYPYKTSPINVDYAIKKVVMDSKRKYIALIPSLGNKLTIMDINNLSIIKEHSFSTIINDASFNATKDTLSVVLLNGELYHFSVPNLNLIDKKDYSTLTSISKISSSPNGEYFALSQVGYSPLDGNDFQGLNTKHFITEMNNGSVIRIYEPAGGEAVTLSFNSSSSSVFIGSESQHQLAFYDMSINQTAFTMPGNIGTMYYARMSHSGKSIASAGDNMKDLVYRSFNYPESIESKPFSVVYSDFSTNEILLSEQFIATSTETRISSVCNLGPVPTIIKNIIFKNGKH